jgi:uncharacterized membrane protein
MLDKVFLAYVRLFTTRNPAMELTVAVSRAKGRISRYMAIPITGLSFALIALILSLAGHRFAMARQECFALGLLIGAIFWFYFDQKFADVLRRTPPNLAGSETEDRKVLLMFRVVCVVAIVLTACLLVWMSGSL